MLSVLESFLEYDRFLAKTLHEKDQKYHCKLPSYILVDGSFTVAQLLFLT